MTKRNKWLVGAALGAPLAYHVLIGFGAVSAAEPIASAKAISPANVPTFADKEAFFGDLHLHTTNSFDAYVLMGTRTTPDDAYRFAKGDTIQYLGQPIRRSFPLDFEAVTDHSENLGVFNQLDDPNSAFSLSEVGKLARTGGVQSFIKIVKMITDGVSLGADAAKVSASTWQREIDTANAHNQPGKFTTFIAYEWTSMPGGQNLHRNVIFKGNTAPAPFTAIDSKDPKDLWTWLSKIRGQGFEALAIPHNGNASNGLMYDWTSLDGKPIDEAYAQLRAANEPLSEVSQNKGTSETHPALSGNDEFANYEIFDKLLLGNTPSKPGGSYWRDALGRGLVLQQKLGVNPYKDGAEGSSDLHSGLQVSTAQEYGGIASANLGGGKLTKDTVEQALGIKPGATAGLNPVILSRKQHPRRHLHRVPPQGDVCDVRKPAQGPVLRRVGLCQQLRGEARLGAPGLCAGRANGRRFATRPCRQGAKLCGRSRERPAFGQPRPCASGQGVGRKRPAEGARVRRCMGGQAHHRHRRQAARDRHDGRSQDRAIHQHHRRRAAGDGVAGSDVQG